MKTRSDTMDTATRARVRAQVHRDDSQAATEHSQRMIAASEAELLRGHGDTAGHARDIRAVIRHKLQAGTLPNQRHVKTTVGTLPPRLCSACDAPAGSADRCVKVEMSDGRTLRWHVTCLEMWLSECQHAVPDLPMA